MSGRAIDTTSQSPREMAASITEAVWKPPVQMTGTFTATFTRRASPRFSPSILSAGGAESFHWRRASAGKFRKSM